jgi:hypothetical protein
VDKTNWTQMYCGIFRYTQHQVREQDLALNCAETVMNRNGLIVLNEISERYRQPACRFLKDNKIICKNKMSVARIERHIFICVSLYLVFKLTFNIHCRSSPTFAEIKFRSVPQSWQNLCKAMKTCRRLEEDYTATYS